MSRQVCPFHPDEDISGEYAGPESGEVFTCRRTHGHLGDGEYSWPGPPPLPPRLPIQADSMFKRLNLGVTLVAAVDHAGGRERWVEHGVVEHAYAQENPEDFALLVETFGHRAVELKEYTASAFLGGTLARLFRDGAIEYHDGPATGRWSYNTSVGWWALAPSPDWETSKMSWEQSGLDVRYVPGQTEID